MKFVPSEADLQQLSARMSELCLQQLSANIPESAYIFSQVGTDIFMVSASHTVILSQNEVYRSQSGPKN